MARSFPSERRNRLVALVAALLVVLGAAASPLAWADDLKDKQREIEKKLDHAHDDLDESSAALRRATIKLRDAKSSLSTARQKLARTRGELTTARAKDRDMQARLVQAEADLEKAVAELKAGREDVRDQQADVDRMLAAQYEGMDPQLEGFAALLNADDPADVTRVQAATRSSIEEQDAVLGELEAAEVMLGVQRDQVSDKRDDVEAKRKAAAENLARMQRLEEQAQADAADVATRVTSRRSAAARAARIRARDRKILKELEADQARIEKMLRNRARRQGSSPAPTSNAGGYLTPPVNGYVTSPYGFRIHPIYGYRSLHDGVDFGAACGTPMYAAADGKVISSYFQTAWGNRMILDHGVVKGVSLASIYNHATKYVVSVGQRVKRGQVVGYVGTTGWSTGCHLHYTVMVNGAATNPMNWL